MTGYRTSGGHRRRLLLAGLGLLAAPRAEAARVSVAIAESSALPFVRPLLDLIGRAAGLEWEIDVVPWSRALMLAERGQALAFGMARTAARAEKFAFSAPVFENHVWMLAQRDRAAGLTRLDDGRQRTLCISRGTGYGGSYDLSKDRRFKVEEVGGDLGVRLRVMLAGRWPRIAALTRGRLNDAHVSFPASEHRSPC